MAYTIDLEANFRLALLLAAWYDRFESLIGNQ